MDSKMKDRLDTILQRCTYLEKMMELFVQKIKNFVNATNQNLLKK